MQKAFETMEARPDAWHVGKRLTTVQSRNTHSLECLGSYTQTGSTSNRARREKNLIVRLKPIPVGIHTIPLLLQHVYITWKWMHRLHTIMRHNQCTDYNLILSSFIEAVCFFLENRETTLCPSNAIVKLTWSLFLRYNHRSVMCYSHPQWLPMIFRAKRVATSEF